MALYRLFKSFRWVIGPLKASSIRTAIRTFQSSESLSYTSWLFQKVPLLLFNALQQLLYNVTFFAEGLCHGLQEEAHPSAMGLGQSKEGFSVFGLMNKCVSPMGKRLLKMWFLRPIINLAVIQARQAAISNFLSTQEVMTNLQVKGSYWDAIQKRYVPNTCRKVCQRLQQITCDAEFHEDARSRLQ